MFALYGYLTGSLSQATYAFWESTEAQELMQLWKACMKRAGYLFDSPLDPLRIYSADGPIAPEEIQTRLTDLQCDLEVSFTRSRSAWERAAFNEWMDENALNLQELTDLATEYNMTLLELESESLQP